MLDELEFPAPPREFRYPAVSIRACFTIYYEGLGNAEKSSCVVATLPHAGVAARWIRIHLRRSLPFLSDGDREAVADWLASEEMYQTAKARISREAEFEYVSGHEGFCVKAHARRMRLR